MATAIGARLRWALNAVLGAIMLAMSFGYGLNVAVRELLPDLAPRLGWIEELSLFGLVWMVFLGLCVALEEGRHIGMRMLLNRLPQRLRRPVKVAVNVIGAVFCLFVAKIGVDITLFVARSGQTSPTLNISMAWLYWVLPIGFALLALCYAREAVTLADRFAVEIDPIHHL